MDFDNKIRDLLCDVPVKTVRKEIVLCLIISNSRGVLGVNIPFGTTSYMAKKIGERYDCTISRFDVDLYEVNNFGGMAHSNRRSYHWDYEEFDRISNELLYGQYIFDE